MNGARIEISSGGASAEEAAAIAAAVEQFVAETTPAPSAQGPRLTGWQRTALLEAIGAKNPPGSPWGEPRGWGALRP